MSEVVEIYVQPDSSEKGAQWRWHALDRDGKEVDYSRGHQYDQDATAEAQRKFGGIPLEIRCLPEEAPDGA